MKSSSLELRSFAFGPTMRGVVALVASLFGLLSTVTAPFSSVGRTVVVGLIVAVSVALAVLSVSRIVLVARGIEVRPHGLLGKCHFIPHNDIVEARWQAVSTRKTKVEIALRSGHHIRLGPWPTDTPRFEVIRKRAIEACEAINGARTGRAQVE